MVRDKAAVVAGRGRSGAAGRTRTWRTEAQRVPVAAIAGAAAAVAVLLYLTLLLDDASFTWLIREEHPIEGAGALGLLAAGIACLVLFKRVRGDARWPRLRRLSLLALALLFLFGFGEEISWGQRIFGIAPPESLESANKQDELNVHNLELLSGSLNPDRLFQLFWLVIGVILPLSALWSRARRVLQRLVPILPAALAPVFLFNQVLTRGFSELFEREPGLYNSSTFSASFSIFEVKETVASLLLAAAFWLLVRDWRGEPHPHE